VGAVRGGRHRLADPNPLGVVPVIPLLNRPRRDGTGRSEIAPVMGNQNAINKLRFDALVASEFVAFPQRWATNIDIPSIPTPAGDQRRSSPASTTSGSSAGRRPTRSPSTATSPDASLGQFPTGDLKPYIEAIDSEIGQMSSISRTPYHYLLGSRPRPAVRRIAQELRGAAGQEGRRQAVHFGEGWEETMRVALIAAARAAKARTDGETIWADPETRNEAARTDSILKQYQAGLLPDEFALEELGYSQQQIARIRRRRSSVPAASPASGRRRQLGDRDLPRRRRGRARRSTSTSSAPRSRASRSTTTSRGSR
jgi:hypothetical protein